MLKLFLVVALCGGASLAQAATHYLFTGEIRYTTIKSDDGGARPVSDRLAAPFEYRFSNVTLDHVVEDVQSGPGGGVIRTGVAYRGEAQFRSAHLTFSGEPAMISKSYARLASTGQPLLSSFAASFMTSPNPARAGAIAFTPPASFDKPAGAVRFGGAALRFSPSPASPLTASWATQALPEAAELMSLVGAGLMSQGMVMFDDRAGPTGRESAVNFDLRVTGAERVDTVPLPASLSLTLAALAGLAVLRRR